MPVSGTVPFFDISTTRLAAQVLSTVTGAVSDSQATSDNSNETVGEFYQRAIDILAISGQEELIAAGTITDNGQSITSGQLSGIQHLQQELAFRLADLNNYGAGNTARLAAATTALAVSGEVQFGS